MDRINSVLEEAINQHAKSFGVEKAHDLAYSAGVTVTDEGAVVLMTGNPFVVLLRLARLFTLDGGLAALESCLPLLAELERLAALPQYADMALLSWPVGILKDTRPNEPQLETPVKS
ncbi:hypothetical protein C3F09_12085 [candidate division GN15 bacterium]|uniref:Uncharacterized protein n=1 Tax=candidate division GN15 bacterium TaxID=2072418 RepID=A0A855X2Y3_9BACT|nr:MAG: hypothetical protein C3F09_12085 [candidate division GN15 bacterium]